MLLDLVPASRAQPEFFHAPDDLRSKARMAALDALNARFGRGTICYAVSGTKRAWRLRSAFVSERDTTNWGELLTV